MLFIYTSKFSFFLHTCYIYASLDSPSSYFSSLKLAIAPDMKYYEVFINNVVEALKALGNIQRLNNKENLPTLLPEQ